MRSRLRTDLTAAITARDRVAVAALRTALAAIDDAEAVELADHGAPGTQSPPSHPGSEHVAGAAPGIGATEVARRSLTEAQVCAVLAEQARELQDTAEHYRELGRDGTAGPLRAQADVLLRYLRDG